MREMMITWLFNEYFDPIFDRILRYLRRAAKKTRTKVDDRFVAQLEATRDEIRKELIADLLD